MRAAADLLDIRAREILISGWNTRDPWRGKRRNKMSLHSSKESTVTFPSLLRVPCLLATWKSNDPSRLTDHTVGRYFWQCQIAWRSSLPRGSSEILFSSSFFPRRKYFFLFLLRTKVESKSEMQFHKGLSARGQDYLLETKFWSVASKLCLKIWLLCALNANTCIWITTDVDISVKIQFCNCGCCIIACTSQTHNIQSDCESHRISLPSSPLQNYKIIFWPHSTNFRLPLHRIRTILLLWKDFLQKLCPALREELWSHFQVYYA